MLRKRTEVDEKERDDRKKFFNQKRKYGRGPNRSSRDKPPKFEMLSHEEEIKQDQENIKNNLLNKISPTRRSRQIWQS